MCITIHYRYYVVKHRNDNTILYFGRSSVFLISVFHYDSPLIANLPRSALWFIPAPSSAVECAEHTSAHSLSSLTHATGDVISASDLMHVRTVTQCVILFTHT